MINWPVPLEENQVANVVMWEVGTDNLIIIAVSYLKYLTSARTELVCRRKNRLEPTTSHSSWSWQVVLFYCSLTTLQMHLSLPSWAGCYSSVPAFSGWLLFWEQLEQQIKLWRDEEGEDIIHKTIFWWSKKWWKKKSLVSTQKAGIVGGKKGNKMLLNDVL